MEVRDRLQALRFVPPEEVVDPGTPDEGDGEDLEGRERESLGSRGQCRK